jgi:hypothetical protein
MSRGIAQINRLRSRARVRGAGDFPIVASRFMSPLLLLAAAFRHARVARGGRKRTTVASRSPLSRAGSEFDQCSAQCSRERKVFFSFAKETRARAIFVGRCVPRRRPARFSFSRDFVRDFPDSSAAAAPSSCPPLALRGEGTAGSFLRPRPRHRHRSALD